jgi:hypothetical protein
MKLTPEIIAKGTGSNIENAKKFAPYLNKYLNKYKINNFYEKFYKKIN